MLRATYNYLTKSPPIPQMFLSGCLYVGLAIVQFWQMALGSDEAGKFMSLEILWWLKLAVGTVGAGLLALKLFTSTSYADYKEKEVTKDNTVTIEELKK